MSFWALKLHCFGLQNDIVLAILSFFFLKKKKKRKKKKENIKKKKGGGGKEIGGGWSHPHGRSGGGRTTPMAKGGGLATPKSPPQKKKKKFGVAESTPRSLGVVRPPPKGQNPFFVYFLFNLFIFGFRGWPDHPQGPGGGFGHPKLAFWGGQIHPQVLGGGPATPKRPKPIFRFFFFFGVWPDHPLGHGGGSTTPIPAVRVAGATPDFFPPPPPLFFFLIFSFFFFLFLFFFFFFKKNNDKMAKTMSF
jgi:hypothetical protein